MDTNALRLAITAKQLYWDLVVALEKTFEEELSDAQSNQLLEAINQLAIGGDPRTITEDEANWVKSLVEEA